MSNLLRLLELPRGDSRWSSSASSRWATPARCSGSAARQQAEVGALVAKKGLSVRETEALVRRLIAQPAAGARQAAPRVDPDIRSSRTT